jgi:hypothetical protein
MSVTSVIETVEEVADEAIKDVEEVATEVIEGVQEADVAVARAVAPLRKHPVTKALGKVSEIADQPPMFTLGALAVAGGVLAGQPKLAETGLRVLLAVGLATAIKTGVKRVVARTRPHVIADGTPYLASFERRLESEYSSFPSGHTADAVAAARAVARVYPDWSLPAYGAAAAIAAIQIPRCAHYPSDVSAGALVGFAAEAVTDRVVGGVARGLGLAARPGNGQDDGQAG